MENHIVNTGTITYALRGRDVLRSKGYSAYMKRMSGRSAIGCGYCIITNCGEEALREILNQYGIKYVSIISGDGL